MLKPNPIEKTQTTLIDSVKTVGVVKARRRINYLETLLIFFMIFAAGLAILAKQDRLLFIDLPITLAIQQFHWSVFDFAMRFITMLGNFPWGPILVLMVAFLAILLKRYHEAWLIVGVPSGAGIIAETIKFIVSRPRPDASLINQLDLFRRPDSFPSGHVMFEVSFFGILWFFTYSLLSKRMPMRNILLVLFALPILLVGLSRIYVGAHWFSDVTAAYLLATVWLYASIRFYRWFSKK